VSAPGARVPFGPVAQTAAIVGGGAIAGVALTLATTALLAKRSDDGAKVGAGAVAAIFAAGVAGVLGVAWLVTGSVKTALIVGVAIPTAANLIVRPALPGAAGSAAALAATAVGTYAVLR
jgi:hypothetical protein